MRKLVLVLVMVLAVVTVFRAFAILHSPGNPEQTAFQTAAPPLS